jgi:preprotein translocase subunit SecF
MENYAMDKLELTLGVLSLNAQGTTAIIAAFLIVVLLVSLRFRK